MKRSITWRAAAAILLSAGIAGSLEAASKPSALSYHDEWRKLLEDHITWTRVVIMAVANELPGTEAYTLRLLANVDDFEAALAPYFSASDVEELGNLLTEHLVIARQILDTVNAGGDPAALIAAWYENGTDIARKMSEMNPAGWPFEIGEHHWREHLDATLAEAVAHFAGDFAAEIAAYDLVHELALEMADFFSNGVIRTKAQFKREICVP
jgi:hypothetical protein